MATVVPAATAADKETIQLRIGAGHTPESGQWIRTVNDFFMPEVNRRLANTKYEIKWITGWGGSIAKLGEVLEAIESNLLDLGYIVYVFEPSKLMLQGMTYRMPFQSGDPILVSKATTYVYNKYPQFKRDFLKYNQIPLAVSVSDPYNLFSKTPIKSHKDVANMKIGAAGANLSWLKNTGSVPVQTNLNECYTSLQTGVYGATIQPTGASYKLKISEVAPYMVEAHFGVQSFGALSVNKTKFESLPAEVRKVMLEVAEEFPAKAADYIVERYEADKKGMLAGGTNIYTLPAEARKAWAAILPNVVGELVKELDAKGYPGKAIVADYYQFLRDNGYEMIRDWDLK
jgi:TRAP-type C4-dicarboxylate transport system substrate-binding protein